MLKNGLANHDTIKELNDCGILLSNSNLLNQINKS